MKTGVTRGKKVIYWAGPGSGMCTIFDGRYLYSEYVGYVTETVEDSTELCELLLAYLKDNSKLRSLNFTMGADPEMFLLDKNNQVIPAFNLLGDQKKGGGYDQTRIFNDGFQAEMSFAPAGCHAFIVDRIQQGLKQMLECSPEVANLSLATTVEIPQEVFDSSPEKYKQFGCAPSRNVYDMVGDVADGPNTLIRSSGGHIHFSSCKEEEFVTRAVKALDNILGVAAVSMFGKIDNALRRKYYGLAGEYRATSYGFEYRTLSSAWLCHPVVSNLILSLARNVVANVEFVEAQYEGAEDVIRCINCNDQELARMLMDANKDLFASLLNYRIVGASGYFLFDLAKQDVTAMVKDPKDIINNWKLKGTWLGHNDNDTADVRTFITKKTVA